MSVREVLNRNPAIVTAATLLVIFTAVGFIIHSQWPGAAGRPPTKAFYTIDDGKTWFPDDVKKLPPFEKEGKAAVRVHIFKCPGEQPFVAYLDRYTPEAKKQMEAFASKGTTGPSDLAQLQLLSRTGIEYKKPGDDKWMKMSDDYMAFGQLMSIRCKNANDIPSRVNPD